MNNSRYGVALADLHLGDRNCLMQSFSNMVEKLAAKVRQDKPASLDLFVVGDPTSGQGMYRKQYLDNLLQFGSEQVMVAAMTLLDVVQQLGTITRIHLLKGHHDVYKGQSLCGNLTVIIRLLGLQAATSGKTYLWSGHGPKGNEAVLFTHGYGRSGYYPMSPSVLRDSYKSLVDTAIESRGDIIVTRLVCAHTHWFQHDLTLTRNLRGDVLGGWVRPPDNKLNWSPDRPTGAIVYDWRGGSLVTTPIQPDQDVFVAEIKDPFLSRHNMIRYAELLLKADRWMYSSGLRE